MKAIRIHEFGGPDVLELEEVSIPVPADDEVLIKVYATSVNPVDWKIREGLRKEKFPSILPLTLGWDVSGVIEQAGASVYDFKIGDEVYGRPDPTKNGAYAEYIVVKASLLSLKPASIDHIDAASIPLAGLTAWQALFEQGHLEEGDRVLIHAAAGGVGSLAVQFAKNAGAYVIGTCSDSNIEFVRGLGADEVIDYKKDRFEGKLENIDLVIDTLGGDVQLNSIKVLKDGGTLISTLKTEFEREAREKGVILKSFTAQSKPEDLKAIAELIDSGRVKPVIFKVMDLESAKEAQQLGEQGHSRGKIVLKVV